MTEGRDGVEVNQVHIDDSRRSSTNAYNCSVQKQGGMMLFSKTGIDVARSLCSPRIHSNITSEEEPPRPPHLRCPLHHRLSPGLPSLSPPRSPSHTRRFMPVTLPRVPEGRYLCPFASLLHPSPEYGAWPWQMLERCVLQE